MGNPELGWLFRGKIFSLAYKMVSKIFGSIDTNHTIIGTGHENVMDTVTWQKLKVLHYES